MFLPDKTWIIPAFWLLLWTYIYGWLIKQFGFDLNICLTDSIISNILLIAIGIGAIITVHFYRPSSSKWYVYIAGIIAGAVLWAWTTKLILIYLFPDENTYHIFLFKLFPLKIVIGVLFISLFVMLGWILATLKDAQEEEKRREEIYRMVQEAELVNLRQQMQPHFLFNTLNSVSSLVNINQNQASLMIQQLSDFLRGTLNRDEKGVTTLKQELDHLHLYLEIEKVRFGDRLKTIVHADESILPLLLPPLTLQPMVENAIKFGLYDTLGEVLIRIIATYENNMLVIQISNPFDPDTRDALKGTGFGLSSIQRRFYILFGRNDLLETKMDGNIFSVTVKIPQQP